MLLCGLMIALGYRKCRKNKKRQEDYRETDTNTSNLPFGTTSADGLDISDIKRLQRLKGKWADSESEDLPAKELDPATRRKI